MYPISPHIHVCVHKCIYPYQFYSFREPQLIEYLFFVGLVSEVCHFTLYCLTLSLFVFLLFNLLTLSSWTWEIERKEISQCCVLWSRPVNSWGKTTGHLGRSFKDWHSWIPGIHRFFSDGILHSQLENSTILISWGEIPCYTWWPSWARHSALLHCSLVWPVSGAIIY